MGPVGEERAAEEAEETARRTGPEQRREAKWKGLRRQDATIHSQKGIFSMKFERKLSPRFLIYLKNIYKYM